MSKILSFYPILDETAVDCAKVTLERSAGRKIGFWCVEKIDGDYVYSCMHNAEMALLDSDYFGKVVRSLVLECDEFEDTLTRLFNS